MTSRDILVESALGTKFFDGLAKTHRDVLAGHASVRTILDDEFVFRLGDEASVFWVILEGRIALEVHSPQGARTIQTLGPDEVLGFSWLFEPHRWSFDARALSHVVAIEFDGRAVREACENDHELGYQLMDRFANLVVKRLQQTRLHILDLYA